MIGYIFFFIPLCQLYEIKPSFCKRADHNNAFINFAFVGKMTNRVSVELSAMNKSCIIRWLNQNIRSHPICLFFIVCVCTLFFINMTF